MVAARASVAGFARSSRASSVRNFTGPDAEARAYRFGMWLFSGALARILPGSPMIGRARAFCVEQGIVRAATEGVDVDGGFTVPVEFSPDIIDLRERFGVFRRNAHVTPMKSSMATVLRRQGGLRAYPVIEGQAGTESEARWGAIGLHTQTALVLAKYSAELNDDAVTNIGDEFAGEIAYAMSKYEDECGFVGDGSPAYNGIVGLTTKLRSRDATVANIAGLVVASGNAWSEILSADLIEVVARLPEYADEAELKWFCSRKFWAKVLLQRALADGSLVEGARGKSYLTYPVEIVQAMPQAEANSQIPLLFGNLRQASTLGAHVSDLVIKFSLSHGNEFANDVITVRGRGRERFDIVNHDVGNASATASARQAGAVVGLITAAS